MATERLAADLQTSIVEPQSSGPPALARPANLAWRYRLTGLALVVERVLPEILPPCGVAALFLITAWLGAFSAIEPFWRMILVGAFGIALVAALVPLARLSLPGRAEIERRLDRSRPEFHRPLATLADAMSTRSDAVSAALWQAHRRRAEAAASALDAHGADARLRLKDRFALRAGLALALVAAAFVAGNERMLRLSDAMDWSTPRIPPAPPRLDAWVDPPAYTGRPPVFLSNSLSAQPDEAVRVPIGSTLSVRSTAPRIEGQEAPAIGLELRAGPGLVQPKPEASEPDDRKAAKPGTTLEKRLVQADTAVEVLRDGHRVAAFKLAVIPDLPPAVMLKEVRAESAAPDRQSPAGLRALYTLEDDYGIAKAELIIEQAVPKRANGQAPRTLFPPPSVSVPLRLGAGEVALPTEDHPWAGEDVRVRLKVEDDLGQSAESAAITLALPQRPFTQPLARALVEQRRNLNFAPDNLQGLRLAFDALLFEPDRFTPKVGDFLALDMIRAGLRTARSDDRLKEISDQIYDLALFIENGDMTDAERRLREAEARLRDALEREASPEEIKRLAEELRRAMEQFLREFAERALKDQNQNADRQPISPDRLLTQRDLAEMLRRIEEMARSGNTAEAQRLLNELKQMLENLRTARRQDVDPRMRELGQQLEELDRLQREQRDLRDRTFREGQQRQQGQQQQGQRGQRQQGQRGQQQQQGQGEQGLQDQQQALRDRLKQLRERLQQRGMQEGEGFGEADQGMQDAEGQLGQGNPGEATDGQQRALDGLGRAAQGMAQELQRQMGNGEGEGEDGPGLGQPGPSQRGRAENRLDPLGRPQANQRRDFEDNTRLEDDARGDVQGSISERAERVLRELRKRLGEFERPRDELDYLERLLRQR